MKIFFSKTLNCLEPEQCMNQVSDTGSDEALVYCLVTSALLLEI